MAKRSAMRSSRTGALENRQLAISKRSKVLSLWTLPPAVFPAIMIRLVQHPLPRQQARRAYWRAFSPSDVLAAAIS